MARTIKSNALTPGQILIVEGKVYFSRVTRRLDGEDLQRDMQSRKNAGLQPITDPYASLTLYETVAQATGNQVADTYLYESIYQGKKGVPNQFTAISKSKKNADGTYKNPLPRCYEIQPDGTFKEFVPRSEFAQDLKVRIVQRVYAAEPNNGLSFDAILVMEPVRYYERNDTVNTLSQLGINITSLTDEERAAQMPKVAVQTPVVAPVIGSTQISGNQFTSVPNQNPYAGQTVNNQPANQFAGQVTPNNQQVNQFGGQMATNGQQLNPYAGQTAPVQPDFNLNQAASFPNFAANQQTSNIKPAMPGIQPVINQ